MKIAVVEKGTGKIVYTTEVNWNALNYQVEMKQYEAEVWKAAVDDGVLKDADKVKYTFQVLKD